MKTFKTRINDNLNSRRACPDCRQASRQAGIFANVLYSRKFAYIIIAIALLAGMVGVPSISYALPAFPGAEGYGAQTQGGRYDDLGNPGRVLIVDTLGDYNPEWPYNEKPIVGSLRWAVTQQGPRIVIFRVSGTIELKKNLGISNPYITIAGQGSPGAGICIKGQLWIGTHDVVIRYLRFRPGDENVKDPENWHAIAISGSYNVVIDHCSLSWGVDETLSVAHGDPHDVTIQWSIVSETLSRSLQGESHSMGCLVSYGADKVSMHHNLFIHNGGRNPQINAIDANETLDSGLSRTFDIRNNTVYNFGYASSVSGAAKFNFIGNYIISGLNTYHSDLRGLYVDNEFGYWPQVYVEGNIGDPRPSETQNEWDICTVHNGNASNARVYAPFDTPPVTTQHYLEAHNLVLEKVGADLPLRDSTDVRLVNDIKNGTGRIIDSQYDVGGWPELAFGVAPSDRDNDGMPDDWEIANNLNPNNASDATIDSGDGYFNIEKYINSLVETTPVVPNYPPYIYAKDQHILTGLDFHFDVNAGDPEGQPITVTAQNLPFGANFEGKTFRWIPKESDIGTYQVTFIASDGVKQSEPFNATITVTKRVDGYLTDWDPRQITRTGKTYYVATTGNDTNPGTIDAPFATLGKAAGLVNPGDTVIVKGGTYISSFGISRSGARDNPILFTSADGEEVILQAPSNRHDGINIWGGEYIWLNGFTFKGCEETIRPRPNSRYIWITNCKIYGSNYGILIEGSNYIVIENCLIDGVSGHGISASMSSRYVTIRNCEVRNSPGKYGTGIYYSYLSDWLLVDSCDIHHNGIYGYGIYTRDSSDITVRNTKIHDHYIGIKGIQNECLIQNCLIYSNAQTGVELIPERLIFVNGPKTINHSIIAYNGQDGILINADSSCELNIHNSIIANNTRNNIRIVGTPTIDSDYNLYYPDVILPIQGQDNNSIFALPEFVNAPLDLRPRETSPVIDKASLDYMLLNRDIIGTYRPQGVSPDIGAYEYTGDTPTLPGDFDGDGDVDMQDLLIVAKGYGVTYDLQDLLLVAMHYGEKI